MSGNKVLITGGAGFLGYYISKELLALNNEVIIYDAFLNYIPPPESRYAAYLEHRLNDIRKKTYLVRGDVRDKDYLFQVIKDTRPDIVIHLAAIPIAKASNQFFEEAIQINLNGTINLLECVKEVDSVKRFIFVSSSFVYGDFHYEPADEEHPQKPIDIYGGTKLSGEILTRAFGKKYGIDHTIIRPSAVYGPTDANRRVTQILIENAMVGKVLTLHNKGLDRVDFTYVKDTAKGFALAALSEKAGGETFNITRGEGKSIREFVDVLKGLFPDIRVEEKEPDEKRPKRGALAIKKAKKLLGYSPKYSIKEGITEYIEFIRSNGFLTKEGNKE